MAVLSSNPLCSLGREKSILIFIVLFAHLALSCGESRAELFIRVKRAIQTRTVTAPSIPENVSSSVTLFDMGTNFPNRTYVITNNSANFPGLFQVNSGKLVLSQSLTADQKKLFDYEKFPSFAVMINATNTADNTDVLMVTVTIPLTDVNDEPPQFTNKPKPFYATLTQNASPNTVVYTVTITDPDSNPELVFGIDQVLLPDQSVVTTRFQSQLVSPIDQKKPKIYNIVTSGPGGFQQGADYTIKMSVRDTNTGIGSPMTSDTIVVRIGNRSPQFFEQSYKGQIYETIIPNKKNWVLLTDSSNVLEIRALQFQSGNTLTCQVLDRNGAQSQFFEIVTDVNEPYVWKLQNSKDIDYESVQAVSSTIRVTDSGSGLASSVPLDITILDENDNSPTFTSPQYSATAREDLPASSTVLSVTATDRDSGINAELVFSITNNTFFDVLTSYDSASKSYKGSVIVKSNLSPLDYDSGSYRTHEFFVTVTDKGIPQKSNQAKITVTVLNVNDNPPIIVNTTTTHYLNENAQPGSVVMQVQAQDLDGDSVKFYFANNSSPPDIFKIQDTNGLISLASKIPDRIDSYILTVIAVDDDSCCSIKTKSRTSTATFTVNIVGFNANKPKFDQCHVYDTTAHVREKALLGSPVIQVIATDTDRGENGMVLYRIETPDPNKQPEGVFQINSTTGNITVKGEIIRPRTGFIQVTVVARNPPDVPLMESRCTFRVAVDDINDHAPTFSQSQFQFQVSVYARPPSIINQMVAEDKDVGANANITYSFGINDTATLNTFSINPITGVISLANDLNSTVKSYTLIVIANDNGKDPGPLTGTATVTVTINVENKKIPEWIDLPVDLTYSVSEAEPRGYFITTLRCHSDEGQVKFLAFDSGETIATDSKFFSAVSFSKENVVEYMNLTLKNELNYEAQTSHKLTIVCQSFSSVVLGTPVNLVINVIDANDEIPEFLGLTTDQGIYIGSVPEDAKPGATVAQLSATDKDTTLAFRTVTFSLGEESKDLFTIINEGNNSAHVVTTNKLILDRETEAIYTIQILAMDGAPAAHPLPGTDPSLPNESQPRNIRCSVIDVNDNVPTFNQTLYTFSVSEDAAVNDQVGVVTANDIDEVDLLGLDYSFTDGNVNNAFTISFGTGQIRVARKLDFESPVDPKTYNLTLIALDSDRRHTATTMVHITVLNENDNSPEFTKAQYVVKNVVTEEDTSYSPQNPLFLVQVSATDADIFREETSIRYTLYDTAQPGAANLFTVDAISGNVSLVGRLDRDIPPFFYTITVEAKDEIVNPRNTFADVLIYPNDINDNSPIFKAESLEGKVEEHAANKMVMRLIATDNDEGNNQSVKYRKAPNQQNPSLAALFTVRETGEIYTISDDTLLQLLNHETVDKIYLAVQAYDEGTPESRSTDATATITLIDINDWSPYFEEALYSFSILESQIGYIKTISAVDKDSDPKNKDLRFDLGTDNTQSFFTVQSSSDGALIFVSQPVDYEKDPHVFNLTLHVTDGRPGHENTTELRITVLDVNDNAPKFVENEISVFLLEEEPPGATVATFTATDADTGINAEIEYSIVRSSDQRHEFYINPNSGVVITRKKLDREVQETMTIIIMAKDKGEIPLSSTASLIVKLNDTNDNAPRFKENYQPVVQENTDYTNYLVQEIFATDPDTREFGYPFGFSLPKPCSALACNFFTLEPNTNGDNGKGTALVRTSTRFDREQNKQYFLPIVMWDMGGKPASQTATNTLTITIGDDNDNVLNPGHQDILVYNYEGQFTNTEIGRVYADDLDDWDLPDKTFKYISPDDLKNAFIIDSQTGMITMQPGLLPNYGGTPYKFSASVYDRKFEKTVTCTVSVIIQLITDESVRKSGGVRLAGITAEEFVKPVRRETNTAPTSKYQQFKESVAKMLGYSGVDNIEIVSLIEGDNFLDVRFSAHSSPYVKPSQGESAIMLNLAQFENDVGVKVIQVPINLCMDEIYDDGCFTYLNVTGKPELVNANGTSYVMVTTTLNPEAGCVDSMFPDPMECRGDYCFNGGTCMKDDWGKLSCACFAEFDGPRCQQRRHSFDGSTVAFYEGLSVCSSGRTSIDFITLIDDGLIIFSGPITTVDPASQDVHDYLILELKGGYPYLRLNLGGQEVSLQMTGKDSANKQVMGKLSDGRWHHLDIDRDNQNVVLTVDHCKDAVVVNGAVPDWSPCRISGDVPGADILLNVHSLLQLGGRYSSAPTPTYPSGVTTKGFTGCLKNLVHNTKLYDLYYKEIPKWNSGKNGCPREDVICGSGTVDPVCGKNAICESQWGTDSMSSCRCNPGWYGDKCLKEAPTRDLKAGSYFIWELGRNLIDETRRTVSFQMMYRTRQTSGILFVLTNAETKTIALKLINSVLTLSYNMGQGEKSLVLTNAPANVGQWTLVRMERYGNEFILSMDGGEGRYYTYQIAIPSVGVIFEVQPRVIVGAMVSSANHISEDLQNTCIRDVRYNDHWLPMTKNENNPSSGVELTQEQSIDNGCIREDCAGVTCPADRFCYPLWEKYECRCKHGFIPDNRGVCVPSCIPNPCSNNALCSIVGDTYVCSCPPKWTGESCNTALEIVDEGGLGAGAIVGIIIGILLLLILIILLIIFICTRKRSEKEKILVVDPDDDFIRENVMFYDEEGAGEEDHAAYDLTLLQRQIREPNLKPNFNETRVYATREQNAPRADRPDVAPRLDRPDVGNFIKDRIRDAENDDPNTDSTREYNFEGGNSDAGSLSSLNTSSSGGSQDYDYLSGFGPKFAKLADMYGAGQNQADI